MFKIRKGYDSENKTFRLPNELIEKLEILAAQNKISLNQLVIQCLVYAVDNLPDNVLHPVLGVKSFDLHGYAVGRYT